MFLIQPTFTSGFAKNAGESAYPNLWYKLVGIWSPELGKQGDKLYDFSPFKHHGSLSGMDADTDYVAGRFGYALDYDGTNDLVNCGNIPEINAAAQTMSVVFWMKTSTAQTSNAIITYDANNSLSPTSDWYIMLKTNLTLGGFGDNQECNFTSISSASLTDGKWHHVAIIERQAVLEAYIDGIFKQTTPIAQTHGDFSTSHILSLAPLSNVGKYTGLLGQVTLYSRDLTPDEIRQSFLGASPLIAEPSFNYGTPTELTQTISDSLSLADSWSEQITPDNQSIGDTLDLQDSWQLLTNPEQESISDTLELEDTWSALINPESQILSDDLTLSDNWVASVFGTFNIPINLDLRWLALIAKNVQLSLSWLLAKSINTDFRWLAITKKSISTDFRWLSAPYTTILPIAHSDIQIFINGTDVLLGNDVDVETGNIIHTAGQTSQASFVLARKHDDLDRTHLGVASQITNQNIVQIYIDGHLEFDGYIMTINVDSETETVAITAKMDEPADSRHSIALPLPSVNEKLHLYHCLVNTVQVDNPKEDTRAVIVGSNGRYWNGSEWVFYITDALLFATDIAAQDYIDDYIDLSVDLIFESKQPSVAGRERNPQYYHGVKVNLGTKIQQQVNRYYLPDTVINDKGINAQQIEDGTFIIQPNYTYFWTIRARNLRTGSYNGITQYIGTSLASTTTDLWSLISVSPMYQKIRDNVETELGYYYVGSAPYKEISPKNGLLITDTKWQDRNNGLYAVKEASYDYQNYAKLVAGLEYQKLQNVHGDILPVTSASLDITFDAYYYYNVKLLTRINVTNTTVANTYNNLNGFPVSVKSININFASMKITLTTDNRLAQEEIDELDAQMPDEESSLYVTKEHSTLILRKFDLKTWKYVT